MNIITHTMVFTPDTFEKKVFQKFRFDNFKVGVSYLILSLEFKDNSIDTSIYKLTEYLNYDAEYTAGLFFWLKAKIYSFNWDERHDINVIKVGYLIIKENKVIFT